MKEHSHESHQVMELVASLCRLHWEFEVVCYIEIFVIREFIILRFDCIMFLNITKAVEIL